MKKTDIDTQVHNHPFLGTASVISSTCLQPSVYSLKLELVLPPDSVSIPVSGQFFMLRARPSSVLLSRPISVYRVFSMENESCCTSSSDGCTAALLSNSQTKKIGVEFLILEKGNGTSELCHLASGSTVDILGPQGNMFPLPSAYCGEKGPTIQSFGTDSPRTAIIGGGIGIAPVAGFAAGLPAKSYDFYACFRSGSYGLDYIEPANQFISTDDGSCGIKGMLPHILTAEEIKKRGYTQVYACGPEPMLVYVQKTCREAGVSCWLSLEAAMGCGMGACLGCTIKTTEGNKRCCIEGPVFPGDIVIFPERHASKKHTVSGRPSLDLSVTIAGVTFKNPVIAASGTFGYGLEYDSVMNVNELGGICSKGLTLEPRPGNTGIRLFETPSGLINSIGLENPGIEHFISTELPAMLSLRPVSIANLSGSSIETYVEGARLLNNTDIPMVELNISCPNVKAGGMAFGLDAGSASAVVGAVRSVLHKPLIVKLSPNAPDLLSVAHACRRAGADALSLVNTFQAMAINVETGRPVFDNIKAGLAGPAIRPIALRMVYEVCHSMNELPVSERIPVIGLGGISSWQDAVSFIMAGAHAVQVGTATFAQPDCMINIIEGIKTFMTRKGYSSIEDFRGSAL